MKVEENTASKESRQIFKKGSVLTSLQKLMEMLILRNLERSLQKVSLCISWI